MYIKKNAFILCVLFVIAIKAFAQKKTELDSINISQFHINGEVLKSPIDTLLYKFHQYNIALANANFFAYNGNIGLAARNVEFCVPNFGFTTLPNNFFCWDFSQLPLNYYNTTKPFTKIDVVFGSKKQLISTVLHTQNINEYTNVGFIMNGLRSSGFSTRQESSLLNTRFFYSYKPTSTRYNVHLNMDWGRVANQENGGIRSDSSSLFLATADARLVPTYFANAITNKIGGTFTAVQYINLGSVSKEQKDSLEIKKVNTCSKFYHHLSYSDITNLYSDVLPKPVFEIYTNYYEDSLNSHEKTQTKQAQNAIGWNNLESYTKDSSTIYINTNINHSYIEFHQNAITTYFNTISVAANVIKRILQNYELKLNANLFATGYNSGDYKLVLALNKNRTENSKFTYGVNLFSTLQHPSYIVNQFLSNHFKWTNHFKQQLFNGLSAKVTYAKQAIELNFTSSNNYVFYDSNALPDQVNGTISVVSAKLFSDFKLKKINFSNVVLLQKQINGIDVVRLPLLFTRHTIFYEKLLFKKTTPFQLGIEINYNSAYFADAYMPATGQFFIQNKQKIGNYVVLDFFTSFRIKSAKVFLKVEHLNNKLFWGSYYLVPFYPMHDRAFSAGISWSFVN